MYNPPSGYIYDLTPGGINHWNSIVGGVGGPNQGMEKGYVRWANGSFTLFAVPNNASTFFTDRNLNGTTVGWYGSSNSTPPPNTGSPASGLIYTSSSWATLNYPGAVSTALTGINKWNTIIGDATDAKTNATFGFKYQHGGFGKIQFPGAAQTIVTGINDNGVIVGAYKKMSSDANWSGFELQNSTFKKLDYTFPPVGINNSGVIVDSSNIHYPDGRVTPVGIGGAAESAVTGINDLNVVTGFAYYGTFEFQGFTATCK
ncbi:MAG TPA: hypothetical protein VJO35_18130 [Terriglobales bacterium]|nr:hypothetical protein [Terriglobales bacterium]